MMLPAQNIHSDNGDGTFRNPVLFADFPDPDLIQVNDTYYMITTTMFIFPGVTILKSHDLVNWEYCSNAVSRFDFSPCFNLDGCNRYGHGQWATSLKYSHGKYYMLFITLDEGGFICTSTQAEGPWEIRKIPSSFYDPGLFFDEDDRIYVAHGYNKIWITELDHQFIPISKDSMVYEGDIRKGLEGTHVYKINGYYFLYCTYGGVDGIQVVLRSKNIFGPYEQKVVLRDTSKTVNFGVHQGALVKTSKGEWWTILFVDSGPFGRCPSLHPITWLDGWPIVGRELQGVVLHSKPDIGRVYPVKDLPTSDEFSDKKLGLQWGWNHNPDSTKWSLKARPGYLRIETSKIVTSLPEAPNMLTQRPFANYNPSVPTSGTIKMETSHLQEGDIAGLSVFQNPYAYIGVRMNHGIKSVIMVNEGKTIDLAPMSGNTIYIRAVASNQTKIAKFEYSFDNIEFKSLGNELSMKFSLSIFTGNKFGLFNYATRQLGGYVDFDWFHMGFMTE